MRSVKIFPLLLYAALPALTACGGGAGGGTPVASLGTGGGTTSGAASGSTAASSGTTSTGTTTTGTGSTGSPSGTNSGTTTGSTDPSSGVTASGGTTSGATTAGSSGGTTSGSTGTGSPGTGSSGGQSTGEASSGTVTVHTVPPIGAADMPTLGGNTPREATASTQDHFITTSGSNGPPPGIGTVFSLRQTVLAVTNTGTSAATAVNSGGTTLTYNGGDDRVFQLSVPSLGINATVTLQRFSGTTAGSYTLNTDSQFLVYSFLGYWQATAPGTAATDYFSAFTTGFQTPSGGVPTSGQGIYSTTGANRTTVEGTLLVPSTGSGLALGNGGGVIGTLAGDASVTVNFSTSTVNGSITNTVVNTNGSGVNWNNIGLTGTLSGATMSGTTAVTSSPSGGTQNFDPSSTGTFSGALYGPHGEELGITFSLHDPTGSGKTAIGALIAPKTN